LLRKDRSKSHGKSQIITRPDRAQAERAGRRRRREGAKQPPADPHPCAVMDGAQRLEGRWIWIKNRGA